MSSPPFDLPSQSQADSPLFKVLPPAVRCMIYKASIVDEEPLSLEPRRARQDHTQTALRNAANLLATCQQIHDEAAPIYYKENSLLISVDNWAKFVMMSTSYKLPAKWMRTMPGTSIANARGLGVLLPTIIEISDLVLERKRVEAIYAREMRILRRFANINVEIWDAHIYKVYWVCAALSEILMEKKVTMTLFNGDTTDLLVAYGKVPSRVQYRANTVKACQALSCKQFSVTSSDDISAIKPIIEGPIQRLGHDLFFRWTWFLNYLVRTLTEHHDQVGLWKAQRSDMRKICDAIAAFDTELFYETIKRLHKAVRNAGIRRHMQTIREISAEEREAQQAIAAVQP